MYGSNLLIDNKVEIGSDFCCYLNPHHANAIIRTGVTIRNHCSIRVERGANLIISEGVFINNGCCINCMESIEIKANSIIGEGVKFYDHNHSHHAANLIKSQGYKTEKISVGENVWIGSNAVILKGVSIGNNSIIGAGCIIFKSVPENSIVLNNQNQVVKKRD
jgi:acetyltransferase-like isoleucine patch superfamily enzyme